MIESILSWISATVAAILTAIIPGYGVDPTPVYAGYIEAQYVYVAPSVTGRIRTMAVEEGGTVAAGAFLFDMDPAKQKASLRAAQARVETAQANLRNLETGSREAEIEVIRASLEQAKASQALAKSNLTRTENLFKREIVTQAKVDADRAALEQANAHVAQLEAQLDVAVLPARDEQVIAARKTLEAARAEADLAQSQLDDMTVTAPAGGLVETVYFDAGEVAAAGTPVVSILPPGEIKVYFFLPESERPDFAVGDRLEMQCDGCPADTMVTITKMASDPQYTPPMIYSRDERARLVFRAEAKLDGKLALLPGQPVSLRRPQ
jgi:HlyD family secretion protein